MIKLFSLDRSNGFNNNIQQYGFFVHNVLSYESELNHIVCASTSYIVRHGYPGNVIISNESLVKDCDNSIIGGYPDSDELFVCNNQCWFPVALLVFPFQASLNFLLESDNSVFI